jgi:hypothetical protein
MIVPTMTKQTKISPYGRYRRLSHEPRKKADNLTAEEIVDIKRQFAKLLKAVKTRTVFTQATYETINAQADELTNRLYALIDNTWGEFDAKEDIETE